MPPAGSVRVAFFERALGRLEEGLARAEDDIVRDACIQRFEFTFEMAWRAIHTYALGEGLDCVSPRDCFRTGFRLGLMDKDAGWMTMVGPEPDRAYVRREHRQGYLSGAAGVRGAAAPVARTTEGGSAPADP